MRKIDEYRLELNQYRRKGFIFIAVVLYVSATFIPMNNEKKVILAIHGGAGAIKKENMTPEMEVQYRNKMTEALQLGYEILHKGGTAIDAVEQVIILLEDSPLFNAGKGSVFTGDSINELDASIMDGNSLKAGAVAAVRIIKNPVQAARKIMEESQHVMLIGEGAEQFARKNGLEIVDPSYFFDEKRFEQLKKAKERGKIHLDHDGDRGKNIQEDEKYGTVGAVALDQYGNLAAGTSTGGMTNKRYGRVGDTPIIGAGTYANNNTCAVSCTGHGEYFIRNVVAYDVSAMMEYKNMSIQEAAHEVIHNKLAALGGAGGLIALDNKGHMAMSFNTPGMYRGFLLDTGETEVSIYQ